MARAGSILKKYGNSTGRRFAAVQLPDGSRVDVLVRGTADGKVPNAWGNVHPYEETRAAPIYAMAAQMRAQHAASSKPNPPAPSMRQAMIHGQRATLVAVGVVSISYHHAQSRSHALYTHEFDGTEQLWAMADGSLVIRHPRRRLWDDFLVTDGE